MVIDHDLSHRRVVILLFSSMHVLVQLKRQLLQSTHVLHVFFLFHNILHFFDVLFEADEFTASVLDELVIREET